MWLKCLFLALLTQCLALQEQNCTLVGKKEKNLTIQLQVSQSSKFDFSGYIPAVELALHFINSNSCVLPDYHISFTDVVDPEASEKHINGLTDRTICWHSFMPYLLCHIQLHAEFMLAAMGVFCLETVYSVLLKYFVCLYVMFTLHLSSP